MTIFSFLQISEPKSWNHLLWKQGKAFWIQSLSGWAFQKMVLKPPSTQKRMFWAFEKDILQFFGDFWVTKLKPFSGKVRQSVQNNSDQNLVIGSFLENDFEASWSLIPILCAFEKSIFQIFAYFWVTKLKLFSGRVKKSIQNYLNHNLVIESFLENGLEATLSSKTNVLSIWKRCFLGFYNFLSDEVETVFWESEANRLKLFRSKFDHRKLLRKWFWSYL